jgi:hypothetical protein
MLVVRQFTNNRSRSLAVFREADIRAPHFPWTGPCAKRLLIFQLRVSVSSREETITF